MTIGAPLSVVCYVARDHGLAGVAALQGSRRYRVAAIVTHRRRPKAEDPARGERLDFADYRALASACSAPLITVDGSAEQDDAVARLDGMEFDLVASISWRRLITPRQLAQPRLGGVNVHRGRLPQYAGALPIHQALRNGDSRIAVTAHVLAEEIDTGEVLAVAEHPVTRLPEETLDDQVERLKREITPYFGPLLVEALDILVDRHARK